MPTRTIELLLSLEADKGATVDQLKKDFEFLDRSAVKLRKDLQAALKNGDKNAGELAQELRYVEGLMGEIDKEARKMSLAKSLKKAEEQANRTREKMEKMAQVGSRLAMAGAAITAPFLVAMKKYADTAGENEETSKRLVELSRRWEESQVRLGRVTAEILLPTLERAMDIVEKIAAFAEKNPGAIKAALGIGATLTVLGGMLVTASQIVSTIATVQGIAASFGIGGSAATAAAGGALSATGIGAAVASAITTAAPFVAIAAAVAIAAEATRQTVNAITGQEQSWGDIGHTVKLLAVMAAEGWDIIIGFLGGETNFSAAVAKALEVQDLPKTKEVVQASQQSAATLGASISKGFSSFGGGISKGLSDLGRSFADGLGRLVSWLPGRADGGYAGTGIYKLGETGKREFVLAGQTTRAAENLIGGQLTQAKLLSALTGGKQITYHDQRRIDSRLSISDRAIIRDDIIGALAGAL